MRIILIADEFADDYLRGGQLNDAALLSYFDFPVERIHSVNLNTIDPDAFYIVGNFIGLPEVSKARLAEQGNYLIYEKDHKYALVPGYPRHPLVWPNGIVPREKLMWESFYNGAKAVVCLTKWHEQQVALNLPGAKTCNIHGSIWSTEELDLIDRIRDEYKTLRNSRHACIQNIPYKNPGEAIRFCIQNKIQYRLIPRINDKERFLRALAQHNRLVFFPNIPETCSRLLVEARLLGLEVTTNTLSGAVHEDWWTMGGSRLSREFKTRVIPNAIKLFKEIIYEQATTDSAGDSNDGIPTGNGSKE